LVTLTKHLKLQLCTSTINRIFVDSLIIMLLVIVFCCRDPERVFGKVPDIPKELKDHLLADIRQRLTPQPVQLNLTNNNNYIISNYTYINVNL
jgi:hypothetical protein